MEQEQVQRPNWLATATPNPWTSTSPLPQHEPSEAPQPQLDLSLSDLDDEIPAANEVVPQPSSSLPASAPSLRPDAQEDAMTRQFRELEVRTRQALADSNAFLNQFERQVPFRALTQTQPQHPERPDDEPVTGLTEDGDILQRWRLQQRMRQADDHVRRQVSPPRWQSRTGLPTASGTPVPLTTMAAVPNAQAHAGDKAPAIIVNKHDSTPAGADEGVEAAEWTGRTDPAVTRANQPMTAASPRRGRHDPDDAARDTTAQDSGKNVIDPKISRSDTEYSDKAPEGAGTAGMLPSSQRQPHKSSQRDMDEDSRACKCCQPTTILHLSGSAKGRVTTRHRTISFKAAEETETHTVGVQTDTPLVHVQTDDLQLVAQDLDAVEARMATTHDREWVDVAELHNQARELLADLSFVRGLRQRQNGL